MESSGVLLIIIQSEFDLAKLSELWSNVSSFLIYTISSFKCSWDPSAASSFIFASFKLSY